MGAYGHDSQKPSLLFGSGSHGFDKIQLRAVLSWHSVRVCVYVILFALNLDLKYEHQKLSISFTRFYYALHPVLLGHGFRVSVANSRPWLQNLKKKLSNADKQRIEKVKKDPKRAMVIKRITKKGNVSVYSSSTSSSSSVGVHTFNSHVLVVMWKPRIVFQQFCLNQSVWENSHVSDLVTHSTIL